MPVALFSAPPEWPECARVIPDDVDQARARAWRRGGRPGWGSDPDSRAVPPFFRGVQVPELRSQLVPGVRDVSQASRVAPPEEQDPHDAHDEHRRPDQERRLPTDHAGCDQQRRIEAEDGDRE